MVEFAPFQKISKKKLKKKDAKAGSIEEGTLYLPLELILACKYIVLIFSMFNKQTCIVIN